MKNPKQNEMAPISKSDALELAKKWNSAGDDTQRRAGLIKKYTLFKVISDLRGGDVKLGVSLAIKGNSKKIFAGLDLDDDLVFITGSPIKIIYAKDLKSEHLKEDTAINEAATDQYKVTINFSTGRPVEKFFEKNRPGLDKAYKELLGHTKKSGWKIELVNASGKVIERVDASRAMYATEEFIADILSQALSEEQLAPSEKLSKFIEENINSIPELTAYEIKKSYENTK